MAVSRFMQSLWMIVAALLFSLMGVAVKLASAHYNTWEIVFYRGLVGVIVIGSLIANHARRTQGSIRAALATPRIGMHLTRGISGTISVTLWFYSIAGLPIATAMTINYSSPLFIGAWIAWTARRAGDRIDVLMMAVLAAGFIGVMVLLQPTIGNDQWVFATVGTLSAALAAVAYLSVKTLGHAGEPNARIVFYFSAMNALSGLAGASLFGFHAHDARGLALLAGVGLTASLAQLAMTRAFASGGTLLTANLGFTGVVFSSLWGIAIFGDVVRLESMIGMAIIIVSGVLATVMTARALKRAKEQPDEAVASN